MPGAVGSSSSSAVMLELLREDNAPAAILMASADAIFFSQQILGHVNADLQAAMVELTSLLDDALDVTAAFVQELDARQT